MWTTSKLPSNWQTNGDGSYTFSIPGQPKTEAPPAGGQPIRLAPVRSYGSVGQSGGNAYDTVGGYSQNGVTVLGRPRWEADMEREKAELEMEQLRWMIDQMKRNPYGASIRDLIYGKK